MSDEDPAATPDDRTRPESSGAEREPDPSRKPLPKWLGERRREQEAAANRRLLTLVGAVVATWVVLVAVPWGWRTATDPGPQRTAAQTVSAYLDAQATGDCDLLRQQLADATWSQDGELTADEFDERCTDEIGGNKERRPLLIHVVDLGPNEGKDHDLGEDERRVDVGLHRVGDASLAGHTDRVELVREGLAWKVTAIPDALAGDSDQGGEDHAENEENAEGEANQEDDTEDDPDTGDQVVGTPGSDEADASGRVVPAFEWVELQDHLVDQVDLGRGHRCWSYEDRPSGYPNGVPPMIGLSRAFSDCSGEVRVAVRAFPDDGEAQSAAERLVDHALAGDPTAVETQVPGLDSAVAARGRGAEVHAVRDGTLVSVVVESGDAALAIATATAQAQLEALA